SQIFFVEKYLKKLLISDVRFGSKADICSAKRHVRSTPESGHMQRTGECLLSANSGHFGPNLISPPYALGDTDEGSLSNCRTFHWPQ
ncbi:MAG: hypothetical protein WBW27_26420, partial [Pseudolabrys sp.]